MTCETNQVGMFIGRVVQTRVPCRAHFEVTLVVEGFPSATPGQFVQVGCDLAVRECRQDGKVADEGDRAWTLQARSRRILRRPFSIAGLRRSPGKCELDLLGHVVGEGTAWLAGLTKGDPLSLMGPMGRGFSSLPAHRRALLVAGGVGLPPIRWLGEKLQAAGVFCESIYGARTRDLLPVKLIEEPAASGEMTLCVEEFGRHGIRTAITTDDGTCGVHGRVTDLLQGCLDACEDAEDLKVYACGPEPMLRIIASQCGRRHVECEVAMERRMGCGVGACQSCVVRVAEESSASGWRYALCCREGPVFDAKRVIWQG